jgi:Ig-like domain from next to BRCA1 gene
MLKIRKLGAYIPVVKRYGVSGARTSSVGSTPGLPRPQEDDAQGAANDHSQICSGTNIGAVLHSQSAPVDPDTASTLIPSNRPLRELSPKPSAELVDVSLPDFELTTHGESTKKPVSFAFGAPLLTREGVDPSLSRHYSPNAAPLLPVPSPPPALPTEFIRAVPSLHQNDQYARELITGLHGTSTHSAPWWGQSAWVPPTPPAPLPVPLRTPSTPRCSQTPEPLVLLEEQGDIVNGSADTLVASAIPPPESDSGHSGTSLPHVPPMDFNELFDLASQFRHLLELPPLVTPLPMPTQPKEVPNGSETEPIAVEESLPTELTSAQIDDAGTPLSLVALLSKPEKSPRPGVLDGISPGRLLSQLLDSSTTPLSPPVNENSNFSEDTPLRASFVVDNNIPDGQIFPPGAEFVKSWRMRNDGPGPWPADTELVFVAGDKLMMDASERFKVGSVPPGEEVDVWTGEMKAPDVPGKYISYWRLCDSSRGRRFGHSIWIE